MQASEGPLPRPLVHVPRHREARRPREAPTLPPSPSAPRSRLSRAPLCSESGLQPPCPSPPSLEPRGRIWASGGENRGVRLGARWACPTPAGGHRCKGVVSSQAAAVESGKGLSMRTGHPVGWVGAFLLGGQVGELPAAVRGALVPAWPLRPTRRGGSRAGRVDRQGADPRLPSRLQPPRLTPSPTPARSRWPCSGQQLRGESCTWGPPTMSPWQVGAPPTSSLVKTSGWRGWARLGCLGRPTDGQTDYKHPPTARPCGLAAVPPRWDGNDVRVGPPSV